MTATTPTVTRADLHSVRVVSPGRALVTGDAGTAVHVEGATPRVLPRFSHEDLVDGWLEGTSVIVVSETGRRARWDGARWQLRTRRIPRAPAPLALARWISAEIPDEGWRASDRSLPDVALDPPHAMAPTRVWTRWDISREPSAVSTEPSLGLAREDRRASMIHYESNYCCDPGPS